MLPRSGLTVHIQQYSAHIMHGDLTSAQLRVRAGAGQTAIHATKLRPQGV
ncbi:hypothetical protein [Deinococcus sp.]